VYTCTRVKAVLELANTYTNKQAPTGDSVRLPSNERTNGSINSLMLHFEVSLGITAANAVGEEGFGSRVVNRR
jgi:hypothetical protein